MISFLLLPPPEISVDAIMSWNTASLKSMLARFYPLDEARICLKGFVRMSRLSLRQFMKSKNVSGVTISIKRSGFFRNRLTNNFLRLSYVLWF